MAPMLYSKRGRNEEEDSNLEDSEVEDGISSVSQVWQPITSDELLNNCSESERDFPTTSIWVVSRTMP